MSSCLTPPARQLDEMLAKQGQKIDSVIEFKIDDAHLVERISGALFAARCPP
jgi:adenylate kinase family enzyme